MLRALSGDSSGAEIAIALRALGGEWRGGRAALQLACEELCRQRSAIDEQRTAVSHAERTAEGAAARTDSLLVALLQQQEAVEVLGYDEETWEDPEEFSYPDEKKDEEAEDGDNGSDDEE